MARAATTNVRSVREPAGREKSGRLMKYQHLISVGMVFFTCLLIGVAMLIFQHETGDKNSWNMTNTASDFHDDELDQRLDFAKERLQNIMDNKLDAPLPVHHDIYREVNLDLSSPQSSEVVFLNIK